MSWEGHWSETMKGLHPDGSGPVEETIVGEDSPVAQAGDDNLEKYLVVKIRPTTVVDTYIHGFA